MQNVNWDVHVDVPSGPKLSAADTITVEVHDTIGVTLDANAGNANVTYSADAGSTEVPLDVPLVLAGRGAVGLLKADPKTLRWNDDPADPVAIQIFVGRDATPSA